MDSNSEAKREPLPEKVWNLNLDQIEPNTGKVIERVIIDRTLLGPSVAQFDSQTILYSKLRPYLNKVVIADQPGFSTTELVHLRCDKAKVFPEYLAHYLRSEKFVRFASNVVAGAKMPRMVMSEFWSHEAPLPALPEQRRIAAILDKAEALRAKRRAALAKLDQLAQSIFLEMFGDPATNPDRFELVELSTACNSTDDIKCGPFGTQLSKSEFRETGIPLWGIKNVNARFEIPAFEFVSKGTANRLEQYSIIPGDIVMTRKGTIGNCSVYPLPFPSGIMHSDLLRIRTSASICDPIFLSHQLHYSKNIEKQIALISGGAIMPGINVTKLKSLKIILPDINLQRIFSNRISRIESLKVAHRASLTKLDALFASLQHRAFRGEL